MNGATRRRAGRIAALTFSVALILIVAADALLPLLTPASAATPVNVSLSVPDRVVPGSNFTATVNITGVVNFDACNYDIFFDPAVLRLDGVTAGNIGVRAIPVDTWNQISPGKFTIAQNVPGLPGVLPPSSSPITGSGSLAVLQFRVVGSLSTSTSINLSNGVLGNTLAEEIPATWSGAVIPAIPAPSLLASFSISDLTITPASAKVGPNEPVTVSVLVSNTGGSEGAYPVILKVDGAKEAQEDVTLGGGQFRAVSFFVAKGTAGTYAIDVNGKAGQFTVAAPQILPPPPPPATPPSTTTPPPVAPPSAPIPTPTTVAPMAPAPTPGVISGNEASPTGTTSSPGTGAVNSPEVTSASPPRSPSPSSFSFPSLTWPVIGGIGGVIIVIGLFIFLRAGIRM